MKRLILTLVCLLILLLASPVAGAQQDQANLVYDVQYSVPFGVISGKLMALGAYLVFVDSAQPATSFVIPRPQIAALTVDDELVTVDTTGPVTDREGPRTQFAFRLAAGTSTGALVSWRSAVAAFEQTVSGAAGQIEMVYTVKHDHRLGSCRGQLIVRGDVIAYESIDNLGHSRRWALHEIEEIIKRSPYELKIEPFDGNDYTIKLQGKGIEPEDFNALRERVTMARALR